MMSILLRDAGRSVCVWFFFPDGLVFPFFSRGEVSQEYVDIASVLVFPLLLYIKYPNIVWVAAFWPESSLNLITFT